MSSKDNWKQNIITPDVNESFPHILQQVCNQLKSILLDEYDDFNVETTNIEITYKLKKRVVDKRKKLKVLGGYKKITNNDLDKTCSICLEKFKKGKYKRGMPNCRHEFHKNCIDHWLYRDPHFCCPICRTHQGSCEN